MDRGWDSWFTPGYANLVGSAADEVQGAEVLITVAFGEAVETVSSQSETTMLSVAASSGMFLSIGLKLSGVIERR